MTTPPAAHDPAAGGDQATGGDGAHGGDVRLTAWVHGRVQGVGFRWWTRSRALELGLVGHATNKPDGRVLVIAEGPESACRELLDLLHSGDTAGHVDLVVDSWESARGGLTGFEER